MIDLAQLGIELSYRGSGIQLLVRQLEHIVRNGGDATKKIAELQAALAIANKDLEGAARRTLMVSHGSHKMMKEATGARRATSQMAREIASADKVMANLNKTYGHRGFASKKLFDDMQKESKALLESGAIMGVHTRRIEEGRRAKKALTDQAKASERAHALETSRLIATGQAVNAYSASARRAEKIAKDRGFASAFMMKQMIAEQNAALRAGVTMDARTGRQRAEAAAAKEYAASIDRVNAGMRAQSIAALASGTALRVNSVETRKAEMAAQSLGFASALQMKSMREQQKAALALGQTMAIRGGKQRSEKTESDAYAASLARVSAQMKAQSVGALAAGTAMRLNSVETRKAEMTAQAAGFATAEQARQMAAQQKTALLLGQTTDVYTGKKRAEIAVAKAASDAKKAEAAQLKTLTDRMRAQSVAALASGQAIRINSAAVRQAEIAAQGAGFASAFHMKQMMAQERAARAAAKGTQELGSSANNAKARLSSLDSAVIGLGKSGRAVSGIMRTFGTALVLFGTGRVVGGVRNMALELEKIDVMLEQTEGSASAAASRFEKISQEAERLGSPIEVLASGFAQLSAAAVGTSLATEQIEELFAAITEISTVRRFSAEQSRGITKAFEQMLSKGTVQAEELRNQLGDRLPGAFNIFVKAMFGVDKVTQDLRSQFNKLMVQGLLPADELLPKVAVEMKKIAATALPAAIESSYAAFNRFNNALFDLTRAMIESGLLDALADFAKGLTEIVRSEIFRGVLSFIIRQFRELAAVFAEYPNLTIGIIVGLTGVYAIFKAIVAFGFVRLFSRVALGIKDLGGFVAFLRTVLTKVLGPIGLVATALGGLYYIFSSSSAQAHDFAASMIDMDNAAVRVDATFKSYGISLGIVNDHLTESQERTVSLNKHITDYEKKMDEIAKKEKTWTAVFTGIFAGILSSQFAGAGAIGNIGRIGEPTFPEKAGRELGKMDRPPAPSIAIAVAEDFDKAALAQIEKIRKQNLIPQAVGFPEYTKEQIAQFKKAAEAVEEIADEILYGSKAYADYMKMQDTLFEALASGNIEYDTYWKVLMKVRNEYERSTPAAKKLAEAAESLANAEFQMLEIDIARAKLEGEQQASRFKASADFDRNFAASQFQNEEDMPGLINENARKDAENLAAMAKARLEANRAFAASQFPTEEDMPGNIFDWIKASSAAELSAMNEIRSMQNTLALRKEGGMYAEIEIQVAQKRTELLAAGSKNAEALAAAYRSVLVAAKNLEITEARAADLRTKTLAMIPDEAGLPELDAKRANDEQAALVALDKQTAALKTQNSLRQKYGDYAEIELKIEEERLRLRDAGAVDEERRLALLRDELHLQKRIEEQEERRKELIAEQKRLYEQYLQDVKDKYEEINEAIADSLIEGLQRGANESETIFEKLLRSITQSFKQLVLELAKQVIVIPVIAQVTNFVGSALGLPSNPGLAGGQGTFGGGMIGQLGQSVATSALSDAIGLPSLSSMLGFGGGSLASTGLSSLAASGIATTGSIGLGAAGSAPLLAASTPALAADFAIGAGLGQAGAAAAGGGLFGGGGILGLGAAGGPIAIGALALGALAASGVFNKESARGKTSGASFNVDQAGKLFYQLSADNDGDVELFRNEAEKALGIFNQISAITGVNPTRDQFQSVVRPIRVGTGDAFTSNMVSFEKGGFRGLEEMIKDIASTGVFGDVPEKLIDDLLAGITPLEEELARLTEALQEDIRVSQQNIEAYRNAAMEFKALIDELMLEDSPLSIVEKQAEARRQFDEVISAVRSGDIEALGDVAGASRSLIGTSRDAFASSPAFAEVFRLVTDTLSELAIDADELADKEQLKLDALLKVSISSKDVMEKQLSELQSLGFGQMATAVALRDYLSAFSAMGGGSNVIALKSGAIGKDIITPLTGFGGFASAEELNAAIMNTAGYASGTNSAAAGWAVVGEEGPELVRFRGGEKVHTAGETKNMMDNSALVAEVRALRAEMNEYRRQSSDETAIIVASQQRTGKAVEKLAGDVKRKVA